MYTSLLRLITYFLGRLAALVPAGPDASHQGQTGHVVSCSIMLALILLMLQSV